MRVFVYIFLYWIPTLCLDLNNIINTIINQGDFEVIIEELTAGSLIDGHLTKVEIDLLFEEIGQKLHKIQQNKLDVGQTYRGKRLHLYEVTINPDNLTKKIETQQSVLITSLIHARELATVQMHLYMYLKLLYQLYGNDPYAQFLLETSKLCMMPMINQDAYELIEELQNRNISNYEIRKNLHPSQKKKCPLNQIGVDLNRNFPYKWGEQNIPQVFDPCNEEYGGEAPFSEPETQAIRNYLESNRNVVLDLNLHSYGDLWIIPYNYVHDKNGNSEDTSIPINTSAYQIYNEFKREAPLNKNQRFQVGNAIQLVEYYTNGEASDWMLHDKNIISFSPELGKLNTFFPNKEETKDLIRDEQSVLFHILKLITFQPKFINLTICDQDQKDNLIQQIKQQQIQIINQDYRNILKISMRNKGLGTFDSNSLIFELIYPQQLMVFDGFIEKISEDSLIQQNLLTEKLTNFQGNQNLQRLNISQNSPGQTKFQFPQIAQREFFNIYIICQPKEQILQNISLLYNIRHNHNILFTNKTNFITIKERPVIVYHFFTRTKMLFFFLSIVTVLCFSCFFRKKLYLLRRSQGQLPITYINEDDNSRQAINVIELDNSIKFQKQQFESDKDDD